MRSTSLAQPLALFAKLVKKADDDAIRATRGMPPLEIKAIQVIERQPAGAGGPAVGVKSAGGTERTIKQ